MSNTFYTNIYRFGNKILHRGYENGGRVQYRNNFSPKLYVSAKKKGSSFKGIRGQELQEIQPGSIKDAKDFIETYHGVQNFEIHGMTDWVLQYINTLYPNHEPATYDKNLLRILSLDIEVESENGFSTTEDASERINVITLSHKGRKWVYAINEFALPESPDIIQKVFQSEAEMLQEIIFTIRNDIDPDIICGWNCKYYDIPYLINRIKKIVDTDEKIISSSISPWNIIKEDEVDFRGKTCNVYKIAGIAILDYLELYRKYTYNQQENYKLDTIAFIELGKKKVDYSEYDSIREFYTNNFQKFVEYNVVDVDLVDELDHKLNLIDLHVSMAYLAKVNYEDAFGPVKLWDSIIYNHLSKKNIIVPPKVMKEKDSQYAGAYVKEPIPGMYDWVVSFDIASLYPNIIIGTNVSPDTIIENPACQIDNLSVENLINKNTDTSIIQKYDYSLAANGTFYSRNSMGFLAELMKELFDQRKITKNKTLEFKSALEKETDKDKAKELKTNISVYDTKQMALKIALNSAYGVIGNSSFRYYDTRQAEAITLTGQLTIQWIQHKVNKYLNNLLKTTGVDYVIASDTDSIFINLKSLVNKLIKDTSNKTKVIDFLNKFCKEMMTPYIVLCFDELADYMNSASKRMDMKRDVIADRGVWTAKKRYCLNVYDSEGVRYKEPKLKIMGVEVQRSSTPKICRESLKECIKIILTKTEEDLINHIAEVKDEFYKASPEQIAFPRGVSDVKKYTNEMHLPSKGTPIAVSGAIMYNNALKKFGIDKKYTKIGNGDKIKYLHLKSPNTIGCKTISFPSFIPKEFNISKYVDYDTQFQKAFLDPLDTILNAIGWKHEKTASLDGFFE